MFDFAGTDDEGSEPVGAAPTRYDLTGSDDGAPADSHGDPTRGADRRRVAGGSFMLWVACRYTEGASVPSSCRGVYFHEFKSNSLYILGLAQVRWVPPPVAPGEARPPLPPPPGAPPPLPADGEAAVAEPARAPRVFRGRREFVACLGGWFT